MIFFSRSRPETFAKIDPTRNRTRGLPDWSSERYPLDQSNRPKSCPPPVGLKGGVWNWDRRSFAPLSTSFLIIFPLCGTGKPMPAWVVFRLFKLTELGTSKCIRPPNSVKAYIFLWVSMIYFSRSWPETFAKIDPTRNRTRGLPDWSSERYPLDQRDRPKSLPPAGGLLGGLWNWDRRSFFPLSTSFLIISHFVGQASLCPPE